jgi:hypothetical protein
MDQQLKNILLSINFDVLNALARKLQVPKPHAKKMDLVNALNSYLNDNMGKVVNHLSEVERKLLSEAAYSDGSIDPIGFTAKYGQACPVPDAYVYPPSKASPLVLLFGAGYGPKWLAPKLAEQLRTVLNKPAEPRLCITEKLPATYLPQQAGWHSAMERPIHIHEGEKTVFFELRSVLKLVRAEKIKVNLQGRPETPIVKLISKVLASPDFQVEPPAEDADGGSRDVAGPIRAHAWSVLVQQCGWANTISNSLALTDEGQRLLASTEASIFREGIRRFISDPQFDELARVSIRPELHQLGPYLPPVSQRRDLLCRSVARWPVGQWIAFSEVVRFLQAQRAFNGPRPEPNAFGYYPAVQSVPLMYVNKCYLRVLLFESLATLGLVDIAYVYPHDLPIEAGNSNYYAGRFRHRYDGLLYAKLNALGAYCLGNAQTYEAAISSATRTLRVLPNREIAVIDPHYFSPADRLVLAMFATQKSEHLWELDQKRILSHLESGGTVDDVLLFLEGNCLDSVPETVRIMLSDMAGKASVVRGTASALLVEIADETTAALIAHHAQAKKYCRLAGGKHVVVLQTDYRAFRSALKKLGFIIPNEYRAF